RSTSVITFAPPACRSRIRRTSTSCQSGSRSPSRSRITMCRCWCRRGAMRRTAAAESVAAYQPDSTGDGSRGHAVHLERITHRFGSVLAVDDVDLSVSGGELVALLGPSGCGKTTLLRIVAGFLAPTGGRVLLDGAPIGHLPPNRRRVGIVFQSYAL